MDLFAAIHYPEGYKFLIIVVFFSADYIV